MKVVQNLQTLEQVLSDESSSWQKDIFNMIGVVVVPHEQFWELISSCGIADLDNDEDSDEGSIEIKSIAELADYIQHMNTYLYALKDISIGTFRKSELFWAIYYRVIMQNRYVDCDRIFDEFVYGLKAIWGPGRNSYEESDELTFDTSFCGLDEMTDIALMPIYDESIDHAVDRFAALINSVCDVQDDEDMPAFSYDKSADFFVPVSYEDVLKSRNTMVF